MDNFYTENYQPQPLIPEPARRIASVRVFGIDVPKRRARTLLGGLSQLNPSPGAGFFGNLAQGLAGGLRGGLGAGQQYDAQQMAQEKMAADQAQREQENAFRTANLDINLARLNKPGAMGRTPEYQQKIETLKALGYSEKDATNLILNTGQGADRRTPAGSHLSAWQSLQIKSWLSKHPGMGEEDAVAALGYDKERQTIYGQATDLAGRPYWYDEQGEITAEYKQGRRPVLRVSSTTNPLEGLIK